MSRGEVVIEWSRLLGQGAVADLPSHLQIPIVPSRERPLHLVLQGRGVSVRPLNPNIPKRAEEEIFSPHPISEKTEVL